MVRARRGSNVRERWEKLVRNWDKYEVSLLELRIRAKYKTPSCFGHRDDV